jgi:eukaryotic-like serine/threonine-protein kinase
MTVEPRTSGKFDLPPGATVGKYEIARKIATGGMAEIHLARARGTAGFEKLVVLKRILPHVAEDPMFVRMFLDEARLAATLQHPNIADVYDVGESDGGYFFTMEHVHGQDVRAIRIAERNRQQRVPLGVALAIVHGTLSALDYAHEKAGADGRPLGLVHRDVSSSNVLVSYDGAIKLVDFGIARASSSQQKTRTGSLKGKIPYMSPEQARGVGLDRRSDLFSLGVILFELTVGRRPFRGDTDFMVLDQIVNRDAPTPSTVVPEYPRDLEAIVMKLLQRDRDRRFATGDDAQQALEAFIAAHQLWTSPKAVSRYMRTLFADRIADWHDAEQRGVALADHIAAHVTPTGQRGEDLVTPPSAFSGLHPVEERNAFSNEEPTAQREYLDTTSGRVAMPATPAKPNVTSVSKISLRPRRGRTIAITAALGLAVGGGYIAYSGLLDHRHAPAAVVAPEPTETAHVTPPSAPPPVKSAPVVAPSVAVEPPPAPEPVASAPPPPHVVVHKRPPITARPKPAAVKTTPVNEPNGSAWDPNSPYLPGD